MLAVGVVRGALPLLLGLLSAACFEPDGAGSPGSGVDSGVDPGKSDLPAAPGECGAAEPFTPGPTCSMNVGNADFLDSRTRAYQYKVSSCEALSQRVDALEGVGCDTIAVIELLSDPQCLCACGDPGRDAALCQEHGWVPDEARCALCTGCGRPTATSLPSCQSQAAVLCPPALYDIDCETSADPVGCDCLCRRKLGRCEPTNDLGATVLEPPTGCNAGNQAICATRTDPRTGEVVDAACLVHPDHCTGVFGTDEGCIFDCHVPLVDQALAFVGLHPDARQILIGDWNCGAAGECNYPGPDFCMWEDLLAGYGLEKCPYGDTPTALPNWAGTTPCILDFAVSNECPSCSERVVPVSLGDHEPIVVGESCGD